MNLPNPPESESGNSSGEKRESAVAAFFRQLLMLVGILVVGVFVFAGLVLATCFLSV